MKTLTYIKHISIFLITLTTTLSAHAAYKCQGADGRVEYSDRPCEPTKNTLSRSKTGTPSTSNASAPPMARLEKLFVDYSPRLCEREKLTDELANARRSGEIAKSPAAWRVRQDRQIELNEVRINFQERADKITAAAGADSKESIALRKFQQSLKNCDPAKPYVAAASAPMPNTTSAPAADAKTLSAK